LAPVKLKSFYGKSFMAFPPEGDLKAYRLADERYLIFDGGGAMLMGGRWNSPGRRVIYL
jgi:RES domain-containing protein